MLWYVLAAVALCVVVAVVWGFLHLRKSHRVASAAAQKVTLEEVESLRLECERAFRDAFGESLFLEKFEETARLLSDRLDDIESLKRTFAKPEFYWYFVLPVGAFLGEMLRVNAGGEWRASEEGGLEMQVPVGDGSATTYPFDKILKHAAFGDKGDIYAYLMSANSLEQALECVDGE